MYVCSNASWMHHNTRVFFQQGLWKLDGRRLEFHPSSCSSLIFLIHLCIHLSIHWSFIHLSILRSPSIFCSSVLEFPTSTSALTQSLQFQCTVTINSWWSRGTACVMEKGSRGELSQYDILVFRRCLKEHSKRNVCGIIYDLSETWWRINAPQIAMSSVFLSLWHSKSVDKHSNTESNNPPRAPLRL